MRLYVHLFLTADCEAKGCRIRSCSLYRQPGGLVRACCPAHAQEADRRLAAKDMRRGLSRRRSGR
jgi:hypothetical protein